MSLNYQQMLLAVSVVIQSGNVPNIVGAAGIGKSALVQQLADQKNAKLFTTVVSLSEKGDLAIPVPPLTSDSFIHTQNYGRLADIQFGYSHQLIEIIRFAEHHPTQPIYWFLDEFNRGSQGVQSELMNLVLQRSINSLQLPSQVRIIIAENPDASMHGFEASNYQVVGGDDAIKDRTVRLILQSDITTWLTWAQTNQTIHPAIIKYLKVHPDELNQQVPGDDLFPTPRAWERLSNNYIALLKLPLTQRSAIQLDVFAGDVGLPVATTLTEFLAQRDQKIIAKQIFQLPLAKAMAQFEALDQVGRIGVLKLALQRHPAWKEPFAERVGQFLSQLNLDGQYACSLIIVQNEQWITSLYELAVNGATIFEKLYTQIERIGLTAL